MSTCDFSELLGKTILSHKQVEDEIVFTCEGGYSFRMFHEQACCEAVYVEDIAGDIKDLYGSPILLAEEYTSGEPPEGSGPADEGESVTYTFYTLRNINATAQIRWCGSSNGYYSESVSFDQLTGPEKVH